MIHIDSETISNTVPLIEVNWLVDALPSPSDQRGYAGERAIVVATEALAEAVEHAGLTQAELAKRLGVNASRVSHILSERNLTLKTIGEVLWACGLELRDFAVAKLGVSYVTPSETERWTFVDDRSLASVEASEDSKLESSPVERLVELAIAA